MDKKPINIKRCTHCGRILRSDDLHDYVFGPVEVFNALNHLELCNNCCAVISTRIIGMIKGESNDEL